MRNVTYFQEIPIDLATNKEKFELVSNWLDKREKSRQIITLNVVMLMAALKDSIFKEIIKTADLVTIDGYGVILALKKKGHYNVQRLTGVNFTRKLLDECSQKKHSVYFLGGTPKVVALIRKDFSAKWPGLPICGVRDGFDNSLPRTEIIKEIIEKQPNLLLVGLGTPEQELFLNEVLPNLKGTVGIGVGGTFDVLTGIKKEAPVFIREHGWEWCYRMIQEPRRLQLIPDLWRFWYMFLR